MAGLCVQESRKFILNEFFKKTENNMVRLVNPFMTEDDII